MYQKMTMAERIAGRLAVAKINGGAAAAAPQGRGIYIVQGRVGSRYTVRVRGLDLGAVQCDCPAGIKGHGAPCWHGASAWLRFIADSSAAQGRAA